MYLHEWKAVTLIEPGLKAFHARAKVRLAEGRGLRGAGVGSMQYRLEKERAAKREKENIRQFQRPLTNNVSVWEENRTRDNHASGMAVNL